MPYIKKEDRIKLRPLMNYSELISNPGELNYAITEMIKAYYYNKGKGYQSINDIMGALEGAKSEFYRRVAAPYEDDKIEENGDVY